MTAVKTNPLIMEKVRLSQMEALEKLLIDRYLPKKERDSTSNSSENWFSFLYNWIKNPLYYFTVIAGLLVNGVENFVFGHTLFALLPGISNPILLVGSAIFTVLNGVIFCAFEISMLQKALEISATAKELNALIPIYIQQVKKLNNINRILCDKTITIKPEDYQRYISLAAQFNTELIEKRRQINSYQEPRLQQIIKIGLLTFGALTSAASSYFLSTAYLAEASLLGTPIGWAFIVVSVLSGLTLYYAQGAKGIIKLVSPEIGQFNKFQQKINHFNAKTRQDFNAPNTLKNPLPLPKPSPPKTETPNTKRGRFFQPQPPSPAHSIKSHYSRGIPL